MTNLNKKKNRKMEKKNNKERLNNNNKFNIEIIIISNNMYQKNINKLYKMIIEVLLIKKIFFLHIFILSLEKYHK